MTQLSCIDSEEQLEDWLSQPTEQDIESLRHLDGDLVILGVGGKMGPSLAVRAKRALQAFASQRRVFAVSRFSDSHKAAYLRAYGIDTVSADLLSPESYAELPDAQYVIYMVARKFGTSHDQSITWATNALVPGLAGYRYRQARIVTWSTGNVYPLSPAGSQGPNESAAVGPVGEYAQSALARERVFEYFARTYRTPLAILRLNYAVEVRYGVLVDIASKVLARKPVNVSTGSVNMVWQGHANSVCLQSLRYADPNPFILNLTSADSYQVRAIAEQFGIQFGVDPIFEGTESSSALLSNAAKCQAMFGASPVSLEMMIDGVANWLRRGKPVWSKPTHFEVQDGKF